jgi:acid phosphatase (class A)
MRMKTGLIAATAILGATVLWAQPVNPPQGYVGPAGVIDAARYLPQPPEPGSLAEKADREALATARAKHDHVAWKNALAELNLRSPEARARMMCAIDARLTPENAPGFYRLLARSGADLSAASDQSKLVWQRPRPFTADPGITTCYPAEAIKKGIGYSYPSGHSGIGWLWGMILAEIAPDRSGEALGWGASVGDNRITCQVHYPSDVMAGRMLGSAVFARIAGTAEFRADIDAAKAEVSAAKARGERSTGCEG